jgi:type I restriction enzyme S subunit
MARKERKPKPHMEAPAARRVPALRFPGFSGEWEERRLGDISQWTSGGTPAKDRPEYWGGNIPWISASSMKGIMYFRSDATITEKGLRHGSRLAKQGSLLLLVRGSALFNSVPVGMAACDVAFNQDVKAIQFYGGADVKFMLQWFLSIKNRLLHKVVGTGIGAGKLEMDDLKSITVGIPSSQEQLKIVEFLSVVDERLRLLEKKKRALEKYKKGVMQKIFSREIRFKDENGNSYPNWEMRPLFEIVDQVKRAASKGVHGLEVLTISAGTGFMAQSERFSQVIAGNNIGNYTLLRRGEFSYNRGASKRFRYGCIYLLQKHVEALVPNIYKSFAFKNGCDVGFYSQLFSTGYADRQLRRFISSSVRLDGLLNISTKDFYSLLVPISTAREQKEIADFLHELDEIILLLNKMRYIVDTFPPAWKDERS